MVVYVGYNLITGAPCENSNISIPPQRKEGKKIIGDALSHYTLKMGKVKMMESSAR